MRFEARGLAALLERAVLMHSSGPLHDDPLGILVDAFTSQTSTWLLNYKLYGIIAVLLALSFARPVYRWTKAMWVSVAHDYLYGVFHTIVVFPLLAVFLFFLQREALTAFPYLNLQLYTRMPIWTQIALAFVVNDFLGYVSHYVRHKIRPLWLFHVIHHSQENMNPLTVKRSHFVERFVEHGIFRTLPFLVLGSPAEAWAIYYALDAAWDYFTHSNIKTDLGPLRYVFVSPQYHRLHHSRLPEHMDKNFSDRLVIWDLLFRTASFDYKRDFPTGVDEPGFALEGSARPMSFVRVFFQQLWFPFRANFALLRRRAVPLPVGAGE